MTIQQELLRDAFAAYRGEQYGPLVASLSLPDINPVSRDTFNTIYCKPPQKETSYDYFRTIRRATGYNAYFHIPFCRTECIYCSYDKVPRPSVELIADYLRALETEIGRKRDILGDVFAPDIFYMGGGTPTVLSVEQMERYLLMLGCRFDLRNNREFTVETTPEAILRPGGDELLALLKEHGVNRINVGVQSFSDSVVRRNGRQQSAGDVAACFARLKQTGFDKLNLDLIYGLVGQTPEVWLHDLESAVALQPDSITTFSLRVRPPSRLHDMVIHGDVTPPAERDVLVMRMIAQKFLPDAGFGEDNADYFIKSPDKRYLYQPFQPHNVDRNLIGFGPSAYSLAGDRQIFNVRGTDQYLRAVAGNEDPIAYSIELTREEQMRKRLAEGLRTSFDDTAFYGAFGVSVHEAFGGALLQLREWGVVEGDAELRLTSKGKVLHDYVAGYIRGCAVG